MGHLEVVNVGSYNLPNNVIKDSKAVVGKYAATDLYAGDYLFDSKLSTNNKSAEDVLIVRRKLTVKEIISRVQ